MAITEQTQSRHDCVLILTPVRRTEGMSCGEGVIETQIPVSGEGPPQDSGATPCLKQEGEWLVERSVRINSLHQHYCIKFWTLVGISKEMIMCIFYTVLHIHMYVIIPVPYSMLKRPLRWTVTKKLEQLQGPESFKHPALSGSRLPMSPFYTGASNPY